MSRFEDRYFGDNYKVIRSFQDGTTKLFLERNKHPAVGKWVAEDRFISSPCQFGSGTWLAVFDEDGARTAYFPGVECPSDEVALGLSPAYIEPWSSPDHAG